MLDGIKFPIPEEKFVDTKVVIISRKMKTYIQ
jgi:hypothetical protein